MKALLLWVVLLTALTITSAVARTKDADRVVVVRNDNSPVSRAVADDYALRRGIRNVATIRCQDSAVDALAETIDLASYRRDIEAPLRVFLASHPGIDFIVLTKGIPIRFRGTGKSNGAGNSDVEEWFSVDSQLAALDYDKVPNAIRVDITDAATSKIYIRFYHRAFHSMAWANKFWDSAYPFSHARFGGYLVTRLDGYTEADAKALTTRSLQAQGLASAGNLSKGRVLLDLAPSFGFTDKATQPHKVLPNNPPVGQTLEIVNDSAPSEFNSDLELAADLLKRRGVPVELDETEGFVGNRIGLMGYVSFGSNDKEFDARAYHSLIFAPGAIAETWVSTSARTFLPTEGGQSLIADLIAQGVTGVKGYTDEPLSLAIASPSIMFDRYTRGWTLAESFYAASALVGWVDIIVGDPLARAYPQLSK